MKRLAIILLLLFFATICWASARGHLIVDGAGDYVSVASAPTLDPTKGSIAIWFRYDATVGSDATIRTLIEFADSDRVTNVSKLTIMRDADHKLQLRYREASGNNNALTDTFLTTSGEDTWHLFVGTWDAANNLDLYIDGSLDNAGDTRDGDFTAAHLEAISIGRDGLNTERYWKGDISDALVFDDELTSTEVTNMWADGRNPTSIPSDAGGDHLIGWWPFTINANDIKSTNHGSFQDDAYVDTTANVPVAIHHYLRH